MHTGNKKIIGTKSPFRIRNNVFLLTFTLQKGKSMPKVDRTDELFRRISLQDDEEAFRLLFYDFFAPLCVFAHRYIDEPESCEDIVQEVFVRFWQERGEMQKVGTLKSFLLKSVQNACISHIRHERVKSKYAELKTLLGPESHRETEEYILYSELNSQLQTALEHLSPVQRKCFELNKLVGMTQIQVADELGIPLRTVELRIAEALKILKMQLKDYFLLVCILFFQ